MADILQLTQDVIKASCGLFNIEGSRVRELSRRNYLDMRRTVFSDTDIYLDMDGQILRSNNPNGLMLITDIHDQQIRYPKYDDVNLSQLVITCDEVSWLGTQNAVCPVTGELNFWGSLVSASCHWISVVFNDKPCVTLFTDFRTANVHAYNEVSRATEPRRVRLHIYGFWREFLDLAYSGAFRFGVQRSKV